MGKQQDAVDSDGLVSSIQCVVTGAALLASQGSAVYIEYGGQRSTLTEGVVVYKAPSAEITSGQQAPTDANQTLVLTGRNLGSVASDVQSVVVGGSFTCFDIQMETQASLFDNNQEI